MLPWRGSPATAERDHLVGMSWLDLTALRAIFRGLSRTGTKVPLLWYRPNGLPCIAQMSHESDGGDLGKAE